MKKKKCVNNKPLILNPIYLLGIMKFQIPTLYIIFNMLNIMYFVVYNISYVLYTAQSGHLPEKTG